MRVSRYIIILVVMAVIAAACSSSEGENTTEAATDTTEAVTDTTQAATDTTVSPGGDGVTIGILGPLTGELGAFGGYISNGYQTAVAEVNATGLLACGKIELTANDSETDPEVGRREAERMISEGVVGIVGPTSDVMVALVDTVQDAEVVLISPYSGTTALNELGGDFVYRTVASDVDDGKAAALWIADEGFERVAVFTQQEEATLSAGNAARNSLAERGINVVFDQVFTPGEASYVGTLTTVLNADPDIIYLAGGQESGLTIINEAANLGYGGAWLFSADLAVQETIDAIGADGLNDVGHTVLASADTSLDTYIAFAASHQELTKVEPGPFSANAYDSIILMALAMQASGGCDGASINASLRDVADGGTKVGSFEEGSKLLAAGEDIDYDGASGPVAFDDSGTVVGSYSVQQVQDGAWVDIKFYPATALE